MGLFDAIANALTGGIANSLQAGEDAAAEFRMIWIQMYGDYPPEDAVRCIRSASVAIVTHGNQGNHSYGAQKVEEQMREYSRAVYGDREKIELATAYLLRKCMDGDAVSSRYEWAVIPIASALR